jgi:stress response protein YsnF
VIEREPIKAGEAPSETADGPRLDEPPLEIVLWAEEPVVSTRAVPTERVRVLRTLGSEQQDLTAQLRRERASFEHPTEEEQR